MVLLCGGVAHPDRKTITQTTQNILCNRMIYIVAGCCQVFDALLFDWVYKRKDISRTQRISNNKYDKYRYCQTYNVTTCGHR